MPADLFDSEQEWPSGLPPEGAEGEDDLDSVGLAKLNEAVVAATDWTTETILRQLERGNPQPADSSACIGGKQAEERVVHRNRR